MLYYENYNVTEDELMAMQADEIAEREEQNQAADLYFEAEHYLNKGAQAGEDLDDLIKLYDLDVLYCEEGVTIVCNPFEDQFLAINGLGAWGEWSHKWLMEPGCCACDAMESLLDGSCTARTLADNVIEYHNRKHMQVRNEKSVYDDLHLYAEWYFDCDGLNEPELVDYDSQADYYKAVDEYEDEIATRVEKLYAEVRCYSPAYLIPAGASEELEDEIVEYWTRAFDVGCYGAPWIAYNETEDHIADLIKGREEIYAEKGKC